MQWSGIEFSYLSLYHTFSPGNIGVGLLAPDMTFPEIEFPGNMIPVLDKI
jgi:hypothetical protein